VGRKAAGLVDILVVVGKLGRIIGQEAQAQGLKETYVAEDNAQALEVIEPLLVAGDVVLVKGSRGMQMEEIVAGLREER
jgi:UDP-N-acetylmuramoyl-tripeptide--D-alanyl-D-alanine ligase